MSPRNLPMIPAPLDSYARLGYYVSDSRVPRYFSLDARCERLGEGEVNEQCPTGEHLWDVIESSSEKVAYDADENEIVTTSFSLVLTCLSCGVALERGGVTTRRARSLGRLNPVPVTAGPLSAQQSSCSSPFPRAEGKYDLSTWVVYQAGVLVGSMASATTMRGRRYVRGVIRPYESVEAPTALACLKKLARVVDHASPVSSQTAVDADEPTTTH